MTIATYADLLDQLTRLIDGEDTNVSDVSIHTLQQIIGLAEKRVYREVQSRWNEKAFSAVTVTSNVAPIPADFESTSTIHFGKKALLPVSEEWLREYLQGLRTGDTVYFSESGTNFYFGPAVADTTAVQGRYFFRYPDLTSLNFSANNLIANESDVFVYCCLAESAPFFGQDARVPLWEAKYQAIRSTLNDAKSRAAFSAGRMRRTPSVTVLR